MTLHPNDFLKSEAVAATGPAVARRRKMRPAAQTGEPVVPQSVRGRFRRLKWAMVALCLGVYYVVPFLRWSRGAGQPDQAILFDLAGLRFYIFGLEFQPQELYYLTALMIAATIALVLTNTLSGRIWCGYFCPQTVWSDLFQLVELRLEGDRNERMRQLHMPMTLARRARKLLKHVIWLAIAFGTGGAFVLYFADAPTLLGDVFTGQASVAAYGAILTLTTTTWLLAGFAREKMCTYMCPWPRLQGAVWDPEALVVTYRDYRGEERMSAKKAAAARAAGRPAGDCVDCMACVHVCPMGIDIRNGPSIACINCGLCVDACDTTMGKLGRERGLIDYESWTNIERGRAGQSRKPVRLLRPKVVALSVALLAIVAGVALSVSARGTLHLGVSHDRNPIAVMLSDGSVRNAYEVRVETLAGVGGDLTLEVAGNAPLHVAVIGGETSDSGRVPISLGSGLSRQFRVTVAGETALEGDLVFTLIQTASGESVSVTNFFKLP